jgi:hypothetical protein
MSVPAWKTFLSILTEWPWSLLLWSYSQKWLFQLYLGHQCIWSYYFRQLRFHWWICQTKITSLTLCCCFGNTGWRHWYDWIMLPHRWPFGSNCVYEGLLHAWIPISQHKAIVPTRFMSCVSGHFVMTGTSVAHCLLNKSHLTMELDLNSNLPFCVATRSVKVLSQGQEANLCVTAESNQNLTTLQKLLTWHFWFGHFKFSSVQWILHSGIFGKSSIFSSTGKCAAWEYTKAHQHPTKSTIKKPVPNRENALKGNILFLGQHVSVDHFVCSAKGCLASSKGKTLLENVYCGGAIFVDQASRYIYVQPQVTFSLVETLKLNWHLKESVSQVV